ncbi:hypothetical protein PLA106_27256 [Pseudomonas amygdali pv. lachrymans str. M302278]|nr:hypothetical protein PLA106_27256 [Pseudomonas amygdali pv. lachrymans str. M302278]
MIRKDEQQENRDFMNGFLGFWRIRYRILLLSCPCLDVGVEVHLSHFSVTIFLELQVSFK